MQIIRPLPPHLSKVRREVGPRILVWLEGPEDEETFREWFMEQRGEVEFYAAGGWKSVAARVAEFQPLVEQGVYGIVDRDFRSAAEVEAAWHTPNARLFILRRYAIENYLLEPAALCEELRLYYGAAHPVPDAIELTAALLTLCQQLRSLMAANWVFFELETATGQRVEHFGPAYELQPRADLVQQAAQRAGLTVPEMERRIAAKEALLDAALATLDAAHTCTNGKHLLHQVYQEYIVAVKRGFDKAHLRRLLSRTVKQHGLPPDIVAMVEQRILQHP